jgi:DNA-binding NarL/FixJ family response regulator
MSIAVSIIEDDHSVREHLMKTIRDSPLCVLAGTARNRSEAMSLIESNATDVYLVDLGLPDVDGVDIIASIKKSCEDAQSLVLSAFGDARHISRSIRAGAMGYLLKDEKNNTLIEKIVALHNGLSPVSPSITKVLFQQISSGKASQYNEVVRQEAIARTGLGGREAEVLDLLAAGLSIIHMADKLFISTHTVNQHLRSIYRKLGVRSRSMAVHTARQNGLLLE